MTLTADDLNRPRIATELNTILARLDAIEEELHSSPMRYITSIAEGTTPQASTPDVEPHDSK